MRPWFQRELERVTQERWRVTRKIGSTSLLCTHGMRVFVPNPVGLGRPFLNDTAERRFVGKVLEAHRPWAEVKLGQWEPLLSG